MKTNLIPMMAAAVLALGGAAARGEATLSLVDAADRATAVVDPATGSQATKTFYTATVPFGAQRYNRETGRPYYCGMTFSMIEK